MLRTGPQWIKDYTTHTIRWGCIQAWKETIEILTVTMQQTRKKNRLHQRRNYKKLFILLTF